jgi:hypothetical protein
MGVDRFFLYQLPISKWRIIRQRLIAGLLFNTALLLEWLLLIELMYFFTNGLPSQDGGELFRWALMIYVGQIFFFLVSAIFAPLWYKIMVKRSLALRT